MKQSWLACVLFGALPGWSSAATLLHCGKAVDVVAGRMLGNTTIAIDGAIVRSVESGFKAGGRGDVVVDLKSHTCMPGLIDMHVHLTDEYSAKSDIEGFRLNPADYAYRSVAYAERTLLYIRARSGWRRQCEYCAA
jgi:imidazolonepropionase-like amidohydrolase